MNRFFDWLDTATFSIAEAIFFAVLVLVAVFAWDFIKWYRKFKDGKK